MIRTKKIKPTIRQKKVAKLMLDNVSSSKKEILQMAGYGKLASQPHRVLEAEGTKMALAEYGLTEELITTSLVSDIEAKPKNRLGELRLGSEILGMKEGEKTLNILIYNNEQARTIATRALRVREITSEG